MSDNFKQYDPDLTTTVVNGIAMRGFSDGDMVIWEYTNDKRSMHIGTQGDGRHIKHADRSGKVTIRLASFSPSNLVLQTIDAADVPVAIATTDKASAADLASASSCALLKTPNMTKGAEGSTNEWVFQFTKGQILHSGAEEI